MTNDKIVLMVSLTQQMYEDIKFITQHNPTQVVDEDTVRMYNSLLNEVRVTMPGVTAVLAFEEMNARTLKYKDALVVVGQLMRLLEVASREQFPIETLFNMSSDPPTRVQRSVRRNNQEEEYEEEDDEYNIHDEELYGPNRPVHVNADGTVPFSLDDEDLEEEHPGVNDSIDDFEDYRELR